MENSFLKSKKAEDMLTPAVFKIVLALFGIFILIGLGVKLYGAFAGDQKLAQAKASLDGIIGKINFIKSGGDNEDTFLLTAPRNWYLVKIEEDGKQKLCICEKVYTPEGKTILCKGKKACEDLSVNVRFMTDFKHPGYVSLDVVPVELFLKKTDNGGVLLSVSKESVKGLGVLSGYLEFKSNLLGVSDEEKTMTEWIKYFCDSKKPIDSFMKSYWKSVTDNFFTKKLGEGKWAISISFAGGNDGGCYKSAKWGDSTTWDILEGSYSKSDSQGDIKGEIIEHIDSQGGKITIKLRIRK